MKMQIVVNHIDADLEVVFPIAVINGNTVTEDPTKFKERLADIAQRFFDCDLVRIEGEVSNIGESPMVTEVPIRVCCDDPQDVSFVTSLQLSLVPTY